MKAIPENRISEIDAELRDIESLALVLYEVTRDEENSSIPIAFIEVEVLARLINEKACQLRTEFTNRGQSPGELEVVGG
jgi:hypothetical protein